MLEIENVAPDNSSEVKPPRLDFATSGVLLATNDGDFANGLLHPRGGVPKNFAQDIVVAAEILGTDAPMHKYAIQITVADARDGALSGSTLKEASSWGKVDLTYEQMVFSEATLALPLIAGYAFHKKAAAARTGKRFSQVLEPVSA